MTRQSPAARRAPEILAPAGDTPSFLAALAAGADAIYIGLKHFSARMEARNFGLGELTRLTELAHKNDARVYVAMNTLIKPHECAPAYRLTQQLSRLVLADGLIVQDLAMLDLARQAGFKGIIALSTLANVSHPQALALAKGLGASRVILPRELSIDEIRQMDEACPAGLELECFVHGALCYCVSGRCYWSSYMGGKSGLRGRCVQPCRRMYRQGGSAILRADGVCGNDGQNKPAAAKNYGKKLEKGAPQRGREHSARFFSCQDLSLDVLAKTLLALPHLASWKIEGRKKGPHYVFHVTTAYRMLRDSPNDPQCKKDAVEILKMALGRPSTHARFLPQNSRVPTDPAVLTSSGQLVGRVQADQQGHIAFKPRVDLLPQDYLRIGVEDERWHSTLPVTRRVPKGGNFALRLIRHKTPPTGTPVFLIDRREPEMLRLLQDWQRKLDRLPAAPARLLAGEPRLPSPQTAKRRANMQVFASIPQGKGNRAGRQLMGLWLSRRSATISHPVARRTAWWLPPVVWPDEETHLARFVARLWRDGCRHFVCNAPWQRAFFPEELPGGVDLVAGPFCNITNPCALGILRAMGFSAAFVSPELSRDDIMALPRQSPLPLGFVLGGFWPAGINRFGVLGIKLNEPFASPKGELFWARQYGGNIWIYPGWPLDLADKRGELQEAGYSFFAQLRENPPANLPESRRPGLFNWEVPLL